MLLHLNSIIYHLRGILCSISVDWLSPQLLVWKISNKICKNSTMNIHIPSTYIYQLSTFCQIFSLALTLAFSPYIFFPLWRLTVACKHGACKHLTVTCKHKLNTLPSIFKNKGLFLHTIQLRLSGNLILTQCSYLIYSKYPHFSK